jgi:hypothetical protein
MASALIPDGFTLKKVTKLEAETVKSHLGRERRGKYFTTLLANPTGPPLVAAIIGLASAPTILGLIFDALSKQDNGNGNGFKPPEKVEYLTFVKDFTEGIFELTGAGKFAGDPFAGEAKDFWDKYVTK